MASILTRKWKARGLNGRKVTRIAYGFSVQIPCKPCPHKKRGSDEPVHASGVRQEKQFGWPTRDEAEKELAKFQLGIEEKGAAASAPTFGQATERYLTAKARKRSLTEDRRILDHLKAAFGAGTPLTEITASRISGYKERRLAAASLRRKNENGDPLKLSAASVNRPLALLRHLLRLAHEEWEVIPAVPKIRLEKEPEGRIRWLEPDEEVKLLDACAKSKNKHPAGIVTVALESGMRYGEILGLTWERVDLGRGIIRLELTKSGRRREIPMRQAVYDVLAPLRAAATDALEPGPDGEVPELRGRAWPDRSIRTAFENAIEEAKLDDFHFHDTRHHFASWFMMRAGDLLTLQKILGHRTLAMTQRYAHLSRDHVRAQMVKTEKGSLIPSSSQSAEQPVEVVGAVGATA